MNSDMSRWLHYIVWTSGVFTVCCPVCVCVSGKTSWWVCTFTIGLILLTMLSSYVTWTALHYLLTNGKNVDNSFMRYIYPSSKKSNEELLKSSQKIGFDFSVMEKEISLTAQTLYMHLILPWYSYISPDEKYALQIKSDLEDLLTGISMNVQQNAVSFIVLQEVIQLFIQSYRQFYNSLKKVSQKMKSDPIKCVSEREAIVHLYKPLHSALRTENGVHTYFQKMSHLLLLKYLPTEVSSCSLFFISLRDYFSYKVLYYIFDLFHDTHWLYQTIKFNLTDNSKCPIQREPVLSSQNLVIGDHDDSLVEIDKDKILSYTHGLSAIKEETSFEMYDVDKAAIGLKFGNIISPSSKMFSDLNIKTDLGSGSIYECDSPKQENKNDQIFSSKENNDCELHRNATKILAKDSHEVFETTGTDQQKFSAVELSKYINFTKPKYGSELEGGERSVKSALGGFISTTAVPLLPDITAFPVFPPNSVQCISRKMWQSPVEEREFLTEVIPKPKKNPFKKNIVDGIKEDDFNRIYRNFQETNFKGKQGLDQLCRIEKLLKRSESQVCQNKNLRKFWRSKSLTNIASVNPSGGTLNLEALLKRSFSCDNIFQLKLAENNKISSQIGTIGRRDKKLKKMNSFDKNDGTDIFSLHSNSTLYSGMQDEELSESQCKGQIPKIISTPSQSEMDILQNELPLSSSLFCNSASPDIESPSFGWENPDLSPIYEESENLASTIAKLRCLLSERQSQHSLGSQSSFGSSESEPKSAQSDPGRYSLEKSRFNFYHKDSTGSLASMKSSSSSDSYCPMMTEEELLEATEVPVDGRVFTYISIPATEVHTELSGFQYTMYIIQYDAIYICESIPASNSNSANGTTLQIIEPKVVLQTNFVKRRFREFLALHSALEEDVQLRPAMKGIKGPNKWLNLPFSKLDAATISSRKLFLEKYLQALVQKPNLNMSLPLKEFLAYGSDTSIAFSKKHIEISIPRLDKILARTVSGVFHSIKTALPTFDSTEVSSDALPTSDMPTASQYSVFSLLEESSSESLSTALKRQIGELSVPVRRTFEVQLDITADEQICEMENSLLAAVSASSQLSSPIDAAEALESELKLSPSLTFQKLFHPDSSQLFPDLAECLLNKAIFSSQMTREESADDFTSENCSGEPIFSTLVDAAVEVISASGHAITLQTCNVLFRQLCTEPLTSLIKEKLDILFSTEVFQDLFSKIRVCIIQSQQEQDATKFSSKDEEDCKKELEKLLSDAIPGVAKLILGREVTEQSIILLIESMQHPIINQDFCLHLLDLLFAYLLVPF